MGRNAVYIQKILVTLLVAKIESMPEAIKFPYSDVSPKVVSLNDLLDICMNHNGSKEAVDTAAAALTYCKGDAKKAMNVRLSLQSYKLLDKDLLPTDVCKNLAAKKSEEDKYNLLAKHILLNLYGLAFIHCLQDMKAERKEITLTTLRQACQERNIIYPKGGKHPSMMRGWLALAGIFVSQWEVDGNKVEEILGTADNYDPLSELDVLQKAFLKALINSQSSGFISASKIVKIAENTYGVQLPEKSLPKLVLDTLKEKGFIEAQKTTSGRGAKPFDVKLKSGVDPSVLLPTLAQLENALSPKLRKMIRKPLSEIMAEIKSKNKSIAGLALEALAFKLMRILDLDYVSTRLRGNETAGAEVDLVFESARLVYSKWQIQCKNTSKVSLDPVAKEVGLTHMLKSNVVVVVSTGTFSKPAIDYADSVTSSTHLNVVLISKKDIDKIITDPSAIVDIFNEKAQQAMVLKKLNNA